MIKGPSGTDASSKRKTPSWRTKREKKNRVRERPGGLLPKRRKGGGVRGIFGRELRVNRRKIKGGIWPAKGGRYSGRGKIDS